MLFAAAPEINYELARLLFRFCNLRKPLLLINRTPLEKNNSRDVPYILLFIFLINRVFSACNRSCEPEDMNVNRYRGIRSAVQCS